MDTFQLPPGTIRDTTALQDHLKEIIEHLGFNKKLPGDYAGLTPSKSELLSVFHSLHDAALKHATHFGEHLQQSFTAYRLSKKGHLTGYYTPVFPASSTPTAEYCHPLYAYPKSLPAPLPTRRQIERESRLKGMGLELFWLKNELDAYLVHVQGSAVLNLKDTRRVRLAYAGSNGHPYKSLGKMLTSANEINPKDISLNAIRKWHRENPGRLSEFTVQNPRYIFFRQSESMPRGAVGLPVSPFLSLAAERNSNGKYRYPVFFPFLINIPSTNTSYLAFVEDTGSAIVGEGRFDLYCGSGDKAADSAGNLNHDAEIYLLYPGHLLEPDVIGTSRVKKSE